MTNRPTTDTERPPFDWTIDQDATWPPLGLRPPPYGATTLEVMRSCPVRTFFDSSKGYERRMGYAARVGTAYHLALESLANDPPYPSTGGEIAEEARRRFYVELDKQDALAGRRPRERGLPKDEARINRALEAIVVEAQQLAHFAGPAPQAYSSLPAEQPSPPTAVEPESAPGLFQVEVEQEVRSKDGLFYGRIDRVEHHPDGIRLIDTKTALRDDVPERYERQLQLYAYLWHETRGQWPVEAILVYPFTATRHVVQIDPAVCLRVAEEYRELITHIQEERNTGRLATPGVVCQVCEFRPWCKPFWNWQSSEKTYSTALDHAYYGFEAEISTLETINRHWKIILNWRGYAVKVIAPIERFPQLKQAAPGMRLRCLEMRLHGNQFAPTAQVTEYSELYLLKPNKQD